MFNFNADQMRLDDGEATGRRRVAAPSNPRMSEEETATLLAEENAKYDPRTGMPLDLLESGIPEVIQSFTMPGFTPGPFPKEFEKFFGAADPNMIGYKIVTNPDGSQQLEVQTGPGSTQTFGAPIKVSADGTVKPFERTTGLNPPNTTVTTGLKTAEQIALDTKNEADKARRKSAYDTLYEEFDQYGLGSLVSDIKNILVDGTLDPTEFSLKVRGTDAYKARFIANEARMAKGLRALSPAAYIALEDKYQEVMRQYGLPESYYAKTGTGVQEGFRKLIENDVSNLELEDRIATAQKRVINSNPEVLASLKAFYPDITNADILAYTLDPKNAIENIKRKVTAAEIGGAAVQSGLNLGQKPEEIARYAARAAELAAAGVTKQQAQQGFQTVAEVAPRGGQLAAIYGESPYTQQTAEAEIFGLAGSAEATRQRKKLTSLETAAFGGRAGAGAIARDRAGVL
jgi:hypothetical protein